MTFDEKWLADYCKRTGQKVPIPTNEPRKRSKYGNKKSVMDGIEFDSTHEMNVYAQLKLDVQAGNYRALITQVPFKLPAVEYVCDFVTLNNDGTYTVWDAKSEATAKDKVYRIKKKLMKECLGIEIREIIK